MMQEMIAHGILFQGLFFPTWSHQQVEMDMIVMAFNESCSVYRKAIDLGTTKDLLIGPVVKQVFRKII